MQLSFRLGVIFILLAAAAWGLGGVAGQFLFQFYDVGAPLSLIHISEPTRPY